MMKDGHVRAFLEQLGARAPQDPIVVVTALISEISLTRICFRLLLGRGN